MKVMIAGYGRMGKLIEETLMAEGDGIHEIVARIDVEPNETKGIYDACALASLDSIADIFDTLTTIGTVLIVLGVIALAVVEQRLAREERRLNPPEKKYRFGALALLFPILYCLFDTLGTSADGIILDEEVGLGLGEIDVLILYGLTFLLAGIAAWIFLWVREKKPYNPFAKTERPKALAACCEEFGQVFYVFAMSRNPIVAAPMVASYCVISVLLGHIFLKEKLKAAQYACVLAVIAGIIVIGFTGE